MTVKNTKISLLLCSIAWSQFQSKPVETLRKTGALWRHGFENVDKNQQHCLRMWQTCHWMLLTWILRVCACPLDVARCSFWDRSRNPLGTLGLLHSSHILLWRGVHFDKEILRSDLDKEVFSREPARRSCLRDLLLGACTEILPQDLLEN